MAEWISVNDRLPEESTYTPVNIVWMNTSQEPWFKSIRNKPFVATAYYYRGTWWWFSKMCGVHLREYGESEIERMADEIVVTHWMPIPDAPSN